MIKEAFVSQKYRWLLLKDFTLLRHQYLHPPSFGMIATHFELIF